MLLSAYTVVIRSFVKCSKILACNSAVSVFLSFRANADQLHVLIPLS